MFEPKVGARYSALRQLVVEDKRNMGMLNRRRKEGVSPHTMMGMTMCSVYPTQTTKMFTLTCIFCTVLAMSVLSVTMLTMWRRYYKTAASGRAITEIC